MSEISVNGVRRACTSGTTVAALVADLTPNPDGCAVAVNDQVVPRSDWPSRQVQPGDRVEVLTAVQGG